MENIEVVGSNETVTDVEKQAVLKLAAELDKRWNQRDATDFANLFTEDADFRFFFRSLDQGER